MLIPQFTLRKLFAIVSGASLVCLVLSFAARGHRWAVAMWLGVLALAATLAIFALLFWLVWLFTTISDARANRRAARNAIVAVEVGPPRIE